MSRRRRRRQRQSTACSADAPWVVVQLEVARASSPCPVTAKMAVPLQTAPLPFLESHGFRHGASVRSSPEDAGAIGPSNVHRMPALSKGIRPKPTKTGNERKVVDHYPGEQGKDHAAESRSHAGQAPDGPHQVLRVYVRRDKPAGWNSNPCIPAWPAPRAQWRCARRAPKPREWRWSSAMAKSVTPPLRATVREKPRAIIQPETAPPHRFPRPATA